MAQTRQVAPPIKLNDEPENTAAVAEESTAVSTRGGSLVAYDFGEDTGAGYENIGKEEELTPFLKDVQPLSHCCDRSKPAYDPDARPGMLMNSATGKLYDGAVGIELLACWDEHLATRWLSNERSSSGFRGTMVFDDPLIIKLRKKQGPFKPLVYFDETSGERGEEISIVDQYNVGIIYAVPNFAAAEETGRAILAFTSTKIPVFRSWITAMKDIRYPHPVTGERVRPPLWAHRVRLVVVNQTNKKGSFFNFRLRLAEQGPPQNSLLAPTDPVYLLGKEFYQLWHAKEVRADYAAAEGAAAVAAGDDVPF